MGLSNPRLSGMVLQTLASTTNTALAAAGTIIHNVDLRSFIGTGYFWVVIRAGDALLTDVDIDVETIARNYANSGWEVTQNSGLAQKVLEAADMSGVGDRTIVVDLHKYYQDNGDENILLGGEGFRVTVTKTGGDAGIVQVDVLGR